MCANINTQKLNPHKILKVLLTTANKTGCTVLVYSLLRSWVIQSVIHSQIVPLSVIVCQHQDTLDSPTPPTLLTGLTNFKQLLQC